MMTKVNQNLSTKPSCIRLALTSTKILGQR